MLLISHRGNLNGPNPEKENNPLYITKALDLGYDVEIDVWLVQDKLYLGHDSPQYLINLDFLKNNKLWCHAKNVEALSFMIDNGVHCFWHQQDNYCLTTKNIIWAYPGHAKFFPNKCIDVMPELENNNFTEAKDNILGICSDYVEKYQHKLTISKD